MYKQVIAFIGACAFFSAPAFAAKPSFNCSKATHEVEKLICNDDELAALDVKLNDLYKIVYNNTPTAAQKRLKSKQIGWSKGRNDCWKVDDQRACVRGEYETRINELKDNKVESTVTGKYPKFDEAAEQTSGEHDNQATSTGPSEKAQNACASRFGGKSSIKMVSTLKPGWWEIILKDMKGRQTACTVDSSGKIGDWVEM